MRIYWKKKQKSFEEIGLIKAWMTSSALKILLLIILSIGLITAGLTLYSIFYEDIRDTSRYITIDFNPLYTSENEITLFTNIDFFGDHCMDTFPASIGNWKGSPVSIDPISYDFYTPDEISGRYYTLQNINSVYIIAVQGPKVHWHNPSNCFLFSEWSVLESENAFLPVTLSNGKEKLIPSTKTTVKKNDSQFLVYYLYLFKDRSDFRNTTLLMLISPIQNENGSSHEGINLFVRQLFGKENGYFQDSEEFNPTKIEGNTIQNGISQWCLEGHWNISEQCMDECPYHECSDHTYPFISTFNTLAEDSPERMNQNNIIQGTYGIVQFDRIFGPGDFRSAMVCEYIFSPTSIPIILSISSDDGERIWLNGALIHSRTRLNKGEVCLDGQRINLTPDFKQSFLINLDSGWNALNFEIIQWKGSWEFYVQLDDIYGKPVTHLDFSDEKPVENPFYQASTQGMPLFQTGYEDQSADEFSSEWYCDDDYYNGESFREFERAVSSQDPVSNIHFTVLPGTSLSGRTCTLGVVKVDNSLTGFIGVKISLNNAEIGTFSYPEDWIKAQFIIPEGLLHEGENTLTLTWINGEQYIVWDYIRVE